MRSRSGAATLVVANREPDATQSIEPRAVPTSKFTRFGDNQDPTELAPFPPNARVERFIPQATLYPRPPSSSITAERAPRSARSPTASHT